jgi:hypothetical protein
VFLYQAAGKDWTEDIEYWWTGPAADGWWDVGVGKSPRPESQVPGQRGADGECPNPWRTQVKHPQLESSLACCYQQWALLRSPSRQLVSKHLKHPSGVQPGFLPVPGQSDTATGLGVGVDQ